MKSTFEPSVTTDVGLSVRLRRIEPEIVEYLKSPPDAARIDEILRLLQALNSEHGKTIVMVTHDAQAAEFAKRMLHCDKGTLEAREAA